MNDEECPFYLNIIHISNTEYSWRKSCNFGLKDDPSTMMQNCYAKIIRNPFCCSVKYLQHTMALIPYRPCQGSFSGHRPVRGKGGNKSWERRKKGDRWKTGERWKKGEIWKKGNKNGGKNASIWYSCIIEII